MCSGRVIDNLSIAYLYGSSVSAARQKRTRLRLLLLGERTADSAGASCRDPRRSGRQSDGGSGRSLEVSEPGAERRHVGRPGDVTDYVRLTSDGLIVLLMMMIITRLIHSETSEP